MASTQGFCLRRSTQPSELVRDFSQMLIDEDLTDVTLSCEDGCIQAHRIFLAANSPYFKSIFAKLSNSAIKQYPVIVLKDVTMSDMKAIVEFIYNGEITVPESQLNSILKAADGLKIKGLEGMENVPSSDGERKKKRKKRPKSKSGSVTSGGETVSEGRTNGDSENEEPSSEDDGFEHDTQIMAITDGASAAGEIEPSRLVEQSMTITGDGSGNRIPSSSKNTSSTNADPTGLMSQIDCLSDTMAGHSGILGFDVSQVPSLPGPSGLGRNPACHLPPTVQAGPSAAFHSSTGEFVITPTSYSTAPSQDYDILGQRRKVGSKVCYQCKICGKVVSRRESLVRHQQVHSCTRNTFICSSCGSCFSWKHGLTNHERKCSKRS